MSNSFGLKSSLRTGQSTVVEYNLLQPRQAGSDLTPLRRDHLQCCFSNSTSFLWCGTACCLPWGRTGSPRFSGVNFNLWIWQITAKRLCWQHQETWHDRGWVSLFISADYLLNIWTLNRLACLGFHYFSTCLDSLFSFSSGCLPGSNPDMRATGQPQHLPTAFSPTDLCSWYWKVLWCYQRRKVNTNPTTNSAVYNSDLLGWYTGTVVAQILWE